MSTWWIESRRVLAKVCHWRRLQTSFCLNLLHLRSKRDIDTWDAIVATNQSQMLMAVGKVTTRHVEGKHCDAHRNRRGGSRFTAGRSSPTRNKFDLYPCGESTHWSRDYSHRTNIMLKVCYHCKKSALLLAYCRVNTGARNSVTLSSFSNILQRTNYSSRELDSPNH